jgi:hypothetical protein
MRKFIYIIIIITMGAVNCKAQIPKNDPLFDTVFVDTFDGSTLKTNKWQPMYQWGQFWRDNKVPAGEWCGGTDVAGMYFNSSDTNNRKISGSTCKMIGRKENKKLERWYWTAPDNTWVIDSIWFKYTNAMLWSKASFKFGYFETRFRMPNYTPDVYNRFSPTFWLWYSSPQTPWSEIDVFEIDGTRNTNNFTNNIWIDTTGVRANVNEFSIPGGISSRPTINLSNWHTAAINWTPNYIEFYLDSTLVRSISSTQFKNLIEMPMIIENGVPATNFCTGAIDTVNTDFPVTYEIDYVKVWQPKCACTASYSSCSVTESTYVSKIYKDISLGGSGCSATFNNKTAFSIEANDFVLLNEGFEAGNNINLTIDVQPYCSDSIKYNPNRVFNPAPAPNEFNGYIDERNNPN